MMPRRGRAATARIPAVPAPARPAFLVAVEQPALVVQIEGVLREAGIAYLSGLQAEPKPMVVFTVDASDLDAAKAAVEEMLSRHLAAQMRARSATADPERVAEAEAEAGDEHEVPAEAVEDETVSSPRGPLQAAAALVLAHLAILFAIVGRDPTAQHLVDVGALVRTPEGLSPLRLVTSLFLHSDAKHVLWNGVSLVAFAVPVIQWIGYARGGIVYLLAGLAGGAAALAAYPAGTVTVGSSGAVAGLFGAWLAIRLWRARHAPKTRHAFVRAFGIGLLVLPTLIPTGPEGDHKVSVASHLGGAAAGLVLGAIHELRRGRAGAARGVS